jgi:hypothetical protein
VALVGVIRAFWAISVLGLLMLAHFLNAMVIKWRSTLGWKGAEKGARGHLLVTLSQDRWVRMQGLVDDLKVATAGKWLREETVVEGFATGLGTLLVYVSAAVAGKACSSVASTWTLIQSSQTHGADVLCLTVGPACC